MTTTPTLWILVAIFVAWGLGFALGWWSRDTREARWERASKRNQAREWSRTLHLAPVSPPPVRSSVTLGGTCQLCGYPRALSPRCHHPDCPDGAELRSGG